VSEAKEAAAIEEILARQLFEESIRNDPFFRGIGDDDDARKSFGDRLDRERANSAAVKLILRRALIEKIAAQEALAKASAADTARIIRLQTRIEFAQNINAWIKAAIDEGREAIQQSQEEDALQG
jgi:hypothetical protein